MKLSEKYPQLNDMYLTRRDEILAEMLEKDDEYKRLCKQRSDTSMELKKAIVGSEIDVLFEKYVNSAYAQDVYELDALYRQGVNDVIRIIEENDSDLSH